MCLLARQWQWSDSTDTCSLSVWARKGYCNKVSCRISESKLCSRQSQEQNQVKEIQSNRKRTPWHTTDNNPAIIQQIWKKIKCKMSASKFRFLNSVTNNQHRKGTRIHLSASWNIFRCAMKVAQSHCTLSNTHSVAKQENCWMKLLTLLAVSSPGNTGQKYIKNHRAFANIINQETGGGCAVCYWSIFWPQCQHLRGICGMELFLLQFSFEYCTSMYQNLVCGNPMPIVNHLDLTIDAWLACCMLLFLSNNKELELRNKPLNKGHLCWTEFHSATFPIFYSGTAKYIRTNFVMHQLLKWHFLCPNDYGVSIRELDLKHSSL